MDNRGANIDIVFRNGLKDYEVLPPPEVWDNIQPVIKRKQRPVILIRAAATITLLLTLSFLAYRWSSEIPAGLDNSVISLNSETSVPGNSVLSNIPVDVTSERMSPVLNSTETIIEDNTDVAIRSVTQFNSSPIVDYFPESNGLTSDNRNLINGPGKAYLNTTEKISYNISDPYQLDPAGYIQTKVTGRWSVAAMASPTYYSQFSTGNNEISKMIVSSEHPLVSYSGGLSFSYKINKRFSVQSGFYYSSMGQQVDGINSFGGFKPYDYTKGDHNFEVLTGNGTIYANNADVFLIASGRSERIQTAYTIDVFDPEKANLNYINNTLQQNFSYVELPVVFRYKVVDKTLGLNLIGGVSYNMLISNSVVTIVDGAKYPIGYTEGVNPNSLSSSFGVGMEYNLSNKLSLNVEPTFRYYLNPFTHISGLNMHPYSFGIFSGLSYKF